MDKLTGWDTFLSPPLTNPFPPGHVLTCFRARGTPQTRQLALEWTERDGSRWIATVDLAPEWRDYALPPEAFKPWQPPPHRRGKDDGFRPENAARFVVGLAHTHTAVEGGRQEYWLADVGTAPSPFGGARPPGDFKPPHWESLCPGYQFFPLTLPVRVERAGFRADESDLSDTKTTALAPAALVGMHPRPRGVGFRQDRAYRWEPLLVAHDARTGEHRGAVAALLVHVKPPFRGGVWAGFTPTDPAFYRQTLVQDCLRHTLERMRRGLFLVEGGAEFFTVFEDQAVPLGARAVNFGRSAQDNLALQVRARSGQGEFAPPAARWTLTPGETAEMTHTWKPEHWPGRGWQVVSELFVNGQLADRLTHELHVWRPRARPAFIEARDGGLWLRGKPWKAHGVNYMPASAIGLANHQHFEHWVGRGAYDPEVIERDLRRVKAMDLNAVSVFIYHQSLDALHLLDFLRRCEALGLKVNLSLRPGTPMDFRWTEMRALIEHYRLAQNDTVFAYDLAWEPSHGNEAQQQKAYGALWPAWVERRYGAVDAARAAWGIGEADLKFEVADFKSLPVPPMKWLTHDGPWRKLVADYRRFLDELLAERYGAARRLVQSIDPHHAVSFRMQYSGDPTFNWDGLLPYDFAGLADAVDIWEPEAYGRIGDWEKVKAGRFTADYARLCDPTKPILWAEMGVSVWDNLHMRPAPEKLAFQAQYYRDFYRLLRESAADGIFFWWYPGGYRLNEQSDYGIINPDGTDRPVTRVIREEGARFLRARKPAWRPDHGIAVDRDRDARGLFGIYEALKDEYWRAVAAHKTVGLRWENKARSPAPAR